MDTISTTPVEAVKSAKPKIIGVSELISSTWDTYKANWQKFATLLIIPLALSFIVNLLSYGINKFLPDLAWFFVLAIFLVAIPVFVISFILSINAQIAQFLLLADLSQPVNFGNLRDWLKRTWPYFWVVIAVSLVYGIFSFFSLLALIIPGIVVMVLYAFTLFVVFFEEKKFEGSFGKSRELVRGYFWPVLGRFCVGILIIWLFYFIFGGLLGGLTFGLIKLAVGTVPKDVLDLYSNLFSVAIGLVAGPLTLIYTYNIYKSLKEVKK